ncbi:unnamed protein product [Effrenium voratum]|uniref:C3H1-type domain-containing protein n=1 Tax=Effrenium voratum TaxID=2562239 RepID=A0AA36NKK3_9DINO|nr:unnamed protein product [Effrenium voratum]
MSLVDSAPVFKARCLSIGLAETVIDSLHDKGWDTHPLLGSADHADGAKLRRLHFESYTLAAAEMKRKVESAEGQPPAKLPPAEVAERIAVLQAKLDPLLIENTMEPSHALINYVSQAVEDGRWRYIEWDRCTTRAQEVNGISEDTGLKVWRPDKHSGVIKEFHHEPKLTAPLTTDLEISNALKRRGVAYEVAQAMSFKSHEKLVNLLFNEYLKPAPDGFEKISISQLVAADREVHVRLAEATKAGLANSPGVMPLDQHLQTVLDMPCVMWQLMPRPKRPHAPVAKASSSKPNVSSSPSKNPVKKRLKPAKAGQPPPKKARQTFPMPKGLMGGVAFDDSNRPICFGYNLGTCKNGPDCPKGRHVCCKAGCFQTGHTFLTHQ